MKKVKVLTICIVILIALCIFAQEPIQPILDMFLDLSDTPLTYTGQDGKYIKVDETNKQLIFDTPAGAGDMTKAVYDVSEDGFVDGNDVAYGAGWNGDVNAPSMNAVYDKIETLGGSAIEDDVYGAGWNGDTTHGPSQNAMYDYLHQIDTDDDGDVDNVQGYNNANWDNAYGWGDHSGQNYLDDDIADDVDDGDIDFGSGAGQVDADDIPGGSTNKYVTAANVGAVSANLDNTDASIEWEDAGDLDSSGNVDETDLAALRGGITGIVKGSGDGGGYSAAVAGTDYEAALTDEASLYATLSDVTKFWEDGDSVTGAIGANEAYSSGWNADTSVAEKDDIYDYLHQFDADDDGSFTDEAWLTGWAGSANITTLGTVATGTWEADAVDHERGGLEADVSSYTGLVAITGGSTAEVDAKGELEDHIADVADFAEADGDTWTGTHDLSGATVIMPKRTKNDDKFYTFNLFNPNSLYDTDTQFCFEPNLPAAITITEVTVSCNADPATELDIDLKFADAFIGLANATLIEPIDTTSGTTDIDSDFDDATVAAGKCLYVEFGADPDSNITQAIVKIRYDFD